MTIFLSRLSLFVFVLGGWFACTYRPTFNPASRQQDFNTNWQFALLDSSTTDTSWRAVQLPHDWSIEGPFSEAHPATYNGGALPGGVGLYRKSFTLAEQDSTQSISIYFDGVYWNTEVWINGHYLGKRPNGYISFTYDLSEYLHYGESPNELLVKVDNSRQPNSRWYSGSGIYRNVYLIRKGKVHIDTWGVYVTTPEVQDDSTLVRIETTVTNTAKGARTITIRQAIDGATSAPSYDTVLTLTGGATQSVIQFIRITDTHRWSLEDPHLYKLQTSVVIEEELYDQVSTPFGVRTLAFDLDRGFLLNGEAVKIKGVCNHHDLGPLGSAVNRSAIERQLDIMAGMGVNAIRTAHNPPAPELLELCDEKGFLVMDEVFDEWKISKVAHGYAKYWDEWYERDMRDFFLRDRNHPSIVIWSIGNEIIEQWDSSGIEMTRELAAMARALDNTRPITTANNPPMPHNYLNVPDVLDVIGYNYAHKSYEEHYEHFPNRPFIATETTSALETRGYYDKYSEKIRRWPYRWDELFKDGNPGNTVSAYDQVSTPWGSTHEETWKIVKKHPYLSGMFIWTGFDYLGEPTPYVWPSRSSYFGVVDLAGFPKDVYYMYKSEWTDEPVLHTFPHWTWTDRDSVDIWVYYSQADEVELLLNGKSLGRKSKVGEELHLSWRLAYEAGELKSISYRDGQPVLEQLIRTASDPAYIQLDTDRTQMNAAERELAFITVSIVDERGILVPDASNEVSFQVTGPARIKAVGNGDPTSHAPFMTKTREAFHGKCLVILEPAGEAGEVTLTASSAGLETSKISLQVTKPKPN